MESSDCQTRSTVHEMTAASVAATSAYPASRERLGVLPRVSVD
jgi:hypothetical protein